MHRTHARAGKYAAAVVSVALAAGVLPHSVRAQEMSSATRKITTQAIEIGGSPTTSTTNALTSATRKTVINVGRTADNQKTALFLKAHEGYSLTLFNQPVVTITTPSLPNGVTNVNYSQTLQANGGIPPYTWSVVSGLLPDGLALNSSTGTISGDPFTKGSSVFFVKVTDSSISTNSAARKFNLTIADPGILLNPGLNTPYNLSADGFVADGWREFTWPTFNTPNFSRETVIKLEGDSAQAISRGGTPWRGGVLQHVPVTPGVPYTARIQAIMASTESGDDNVQIGIGVAQGITADPNNIAASDFKSDQQIDLRFWNAFQATLTPTQGHITVFLVGHNKYGFDTQVTFDAGITAHDTLKIATVELPPGVQNLAYSQTAQITNGTAPFVWSIVEGNLPDGLALNTVTGEIFGTPTVSKGFGFRLKVVDSSSTPQVANRKFSVFVATPLTISPSILPNARLQGPYQGGLQAFGGNGPYTWEIVSGMLPPGLNLDDSGETVALAGTEGKTFSGTVLIMGTPTQLGTSTFEVRVTDSTAVPGGPATASAIISLAVGNVVISNSLLPNVNPTLTDNILGEAFAVFENVKSLQDTDILGVRINEDGEQIGTTITIASSLTKESDPSVAFSPQSLRYLIAYVSGTDVVATILDGNFNVVVPQFTIDNGAGTAQHPRVAWRSTGDQFIILWADNRDGHFKVFSEARAPSGAIVHDDVSIRERFGEEVVEPVLAYDYERDRNLIVYTFATSTEIRCQLFDGNASVSAGSEFIVVAAPNAQNMPNVAYDNHDNEFMVVWQDGRNGPGQEDIFGRRVDIAGVPVSDEFVITSAPGQQVFPSISFNQDIALYFTVWQEQTQEGDFDVMGRALDKLGLTDPNGPNYPVTRISTPTGNPASETLSEFTPVVSVNNDRFLVVWNDARSGNENILSQKILGVDPATIHVHDFIHTNAQGRFVFSGVLNDLNISPETLSLRIGSVDFPFNAFGTLNNRKLITFDVVTTSFAGTTQRIGIVQSGVFVSNVFSASFTPDPLENAYYIERKEADIRNDIRTRTQMDEAGVLYLQKIKEENHHRLGLTELKPFAKLDKCTPSANESKPCHCKGKPEDPTHTFFVMTCDGRVPESNDIPPGVDVFTPAGSRLFRKPHKGWGRLNRHPSPGVELLKEKGAEVEFWGDAKEIIVKDCNGDNSPKIVQVIVDASITRKPAAGGVDQIWKHDPNIPLPLFDPLAIPDPVDPDNAVEANIVPLFGKLGTLAFYLDLFYTTSNLCRPGTAFLEKIGPVGDDAIMPAAGDFITQKLKFKTYIYCVAHCGENQPHAVVDWTAEIIFMVGSSTTAYVRITDPPIIKCDEDLTAEEIKPLTAAIKDFEASKDPDPSLKPSRRFGHSRFSFKNFKKM